MEVALTSWPWAEQVTVTCDPGVAQREARAIPESSVVEERPRVVFTGDPKSLDGETRKRVGMLGMDRDADDLFILTSEDEAIIEPLGIVVQPCTLTPQHTVAINELFAEACREATSKPRLPDEPVTDLVAPGAIEVRLLTGVPRIDGPVDYLAPRYARRVIELVAYLALQGGHAVEGDRLRARVLGPVDSDASPRTMMNLASVARRCLGEDDCGDPRLARASGTGLYRLSNDVSTDVTRLLAMARAGLTAEDTLTSAKLCESALELIEGEPLVDAGGRYSWWQSEGYAARVSAAAVDAACRLAELAGDGEVTVRVARRGIDRARLVEPWSEALHRAAMQVEVAAGNLAGVEKAYLECRRAAEELAPGSLPSLKTEELYTSIMRKVTIHASTA
jgi:DNA-binding SARP family transcriptional activator